MRCVHVGSDKARYYFEKMCHVQGSDPLILAMDPSNDPHNNDPSSKDPRNKDPFSEDPWNKDPFIEDPCHKDPCNEDPRRKEACSEDPHNRDPSSEDPRHKDPCSEDPLDKNSLERGFSPQTGWQSWSLYHESLCHESIYTQRNHKGVPHRTAYN